MLNRNTTVPPPKNYNNTQHLYNNTQSDYNYTQLKNTLIPKILIYYNYNTQFGIIISTSHVGPFYWLFWIRHVHSTHTFSSRRSRSRLFPNVRQNSFHLDFRTLVLFIQFGNFYATTLTWSRLSLPSYRQSALFLLRIYFTNYGLPKCG